MQGSADFCSLVTIFHDLFVHLVFANLLQSCYIPALFFISFSVFLVLSHQLLSVVPLLDLFLHPFSPHAPTIATFNLAETLINVSTLVISRLFLLFILCFKVFPHIICISLNFSAFISKYFDQLKFCTLV